MTIEDVDPFTTPDTVSSDLATTYPFTFKISEGEESSVLAQVTATDGTITYPVYDTDYSIVRATEPLVGGTAQFLTAQPTGSKVVWYRKTPRNQGTPLPNQGAYKAETVEGMIDKVTALGQELVRDVDLALGYPLGTDLDNYSAVLPVPAADKYIVGKSVGGKLTYVESTLSESNLTTYHTGALAAQTAAEAAKTAAETAETNAETAETNAETAETNAAASAAAAAASAVAAAAASEHLAWEYDFDDGVTDADPGTGALRLNNATLASATFIYISQTAVEGDIGAVIDSWDSSTSAVKATLLFRRPDAKNNWFECTVTGSVTDAGDYWKIPIAYVGSSGSFTDGQTILVAVQKHGDAGTGAVDSFNGRTGAVLPATNDYDISEIENAGALASLDTVGTSELGPDSVTLAKMEHGTAGDVLYYGASGAPMRLTKGTEGQFLKQGSSYPEWAGGGKILQVVSTHVTTHQSTTSTSYVDCTGLSASITPSSTTSKILVMVTFSGYHDEASHTGFVRLLRGATEIGSGTGPSSGVGALFSLRTNSVYITDVQSTSYLDSPATTSEITYKLQMRTTGTSAPTYMNRSVNTGVYASGTPSQITLMEIAA